MRWDWWPRAALAGGLDPGSPGDRFQVTVHVEAETFRCREPASAAADTSAETRAIDPPAPEPAAPAADAALNTHLILSFPPGGLVGNSHPEVGAPYRAHLKKSGRPKDDRHGCNCYRTVNS